ncbi:MAG: hypothetical protein JXQ23_03670 [Clostridia bacterium]|nr:hypothetical protein [Clostridia bacterium]
MRKLVKATFKVTAVIFMAKCLFSLQYLFYMDQFGSYNVMQVVLPFFIWLILGVVFFIAAAPLSALIIKNENDESAITLNNETILKTAFVIIGMVLIVNAVPNGISEIISLGSVQGIPRAAGSAYPELIGNVVRLVIGILMIVFSSPLYSIIKKTGKFE